MTKNKKTALITIKDLSTNLGILEKDLLKLIKKDKQIISLDYLNREAVPENLIEKYSHENNFIHLFNKTIIKENHQQLRLDNNKLKKQRFDLLVSATKTINFLKTIHQKYLKTVNKKGYESAFMAAYLIFSKVISISEMFCHCIKNNFYYCSSLFREIDDCLSTAEYFINEKDTEIGKDDLHKWFRENTTPNNCKCRKSIAKKINSLSPEFTTEDNKLLQDESFHKKSKFTHPTYRPIKENVKYKISNYKPIIEKIDYGFCNNEQNLFEITYFFSTFSIKTIIQSFFLCFVELPLEEDDRKKLRYFEKVVYGKY